MNPNYPTGNCSTHKCIVPGFGSFVWSDHRLPGGSCMGAGIPVVRIPCNSIDWNGEYLKIALLFKN